MPDRHRRRRLFSFRQNEAPPSRMLEGFLPGLKALARQSGPIRRRWRPDIPAFE
jgi:hypothetical protein